MPELRANRRMSAFGSGHWLEMPRCLLLTQSGPPRAVFAVTHKTAAAHQPALWNPPRARRIFHPRCAREITAAKDDQLAFWWTHWVADRVGFIRRNRSNTAGAAAP